MMLSFWFAEIGRETLLLALLLLMTAAQTVLNNPLLDAVLMVAWFGWFVAAFTRLTGRSLRTGRWGRWALVVGIIVLMGLRVASAQDDAPAPAPQPADLSSQISVALLTLAVFIGAVNQTVDLIIKPFVNSTIPPSAEMDYWRGWLLRGVAALIGVFAALLMQFNAFAFVHQTFPQISDTLLIVLTGTTAALGSQGLHRVSSVIKQIIQIWTNAPSSVTVRTQ